MTRKHLAPACVVACLLLSVRPSWSQQVSASAPSSLQGFSIVLVLGDLQDGSTPDNIPPAARAALGDLRDFLPYRSYRVLDIVWIAGSTTQLFRATTRLRGADEQSYEVRLTSSPAGEPGPPSLQTKFVMRDAGGDSRLSGLTANHPEVVSAERRKAELLQLQAARAALEKDLANGNYAGSVEERKAYVAQAQQKIRDLQIAIDARQNELNASGSGGQTLIDTSFTMRLGETVVVGTSRVRGDKALVALLTAVRK